MTARVLRPVITLTTVMAILVTAIAAYAFLSTGTTQADSTYNPTTKVKYCNDQISPFPADPTQAGGAGLCSESAEPATRGLIAGANPNITTTLDMVSGDLNFTNVVTFFPNTLSISSALTVGDKVGSLHSETRLGTLNQPCNVLFPVDFVFFNVALPDGLGAGGRIDTSTNITWPQPEGTVVRFGRWGAPGAGPILAGGGAPIATSGFGPLIADSTNNPIIGYPHHLVRAFDTDPVPADGGGDSLKPYAVYGGLTKVAGSEWVPLYFVQFASGGLLGASGQPLTSFTAAMGQPSVSVLNDPTATAASPSTITDFCTPLNVTTMLLGTAVGSGTARVTNPAAGTTFYAQYNASYRDSDQDSYENALDTCPQIVNAGSPRISLGGDADNDGIDASCDPDDTTGPNDFDGDGFDNRQDNCPQATNVLQADSELISGAAADEGPRTDQMGDECDSEGGTKSYIQNCAIPCATPNWTTITYSDTVGNGRYMTKTNIVTKCIEASLPIDQDVDGDGYCIATDSADSGVCATQAPPSCASRHSQWSGATHPGLQMDTDNDHQSDALETYIGTDPVQACSSNTGNNNEPMDNWMFDMNDNQTVNGQDSGPFAAPVFGSNVVNGPFGATPARPGVRFDWNDDGQITGQDTGKFGVYSPGYPGTVGPFNKTCATAGIPAFGQQ